MFHIYNLNNSKPAFWVQTNSHDAIYADKYGNIAIGHTSPNTLLHVYGPQGGTDLFRVANNKMTAIFAGSYGYVGIGNDNPSYQLDVTGDVHSTADIMGDMNASIAGHATIGGYATVTGNINGNADAIISGKVVIGSVTAPSGYSLYVEKGVLADKFKCAVHGSSDWMDFVFDKNYKLTSLKEVEDYIKANKHLPGVPSADDVVCDGIDMAQMDATLLKKIEELTLYMLEMKKENDAMKAEIANLKK